MTFDEWIAVAKGWLPAFDQSDECERMLQETGCQAHFTWRHYLANYARAPADVALHQVCFREVSRQMASAPYPLSMMGGDFTKAYRSAVLEAEEHKLAASYGVDKVEAIRDLYPREGWRTEIDPLLRERARHSYEDLSEADRVYNEFWRANRCVLDEESTRFSSISAAPERGMVRMEAFQAASVAMLGPLGFSPMPMKRSGYVALELAASKRLRVRWSVEDLSVMLQNRDHGLCIAELSLRDTSRRRNAVEADEPSLIIPIARLIDGLAPGYYKFYSARHIWLIVFAYSVVVRFILNFVMKAAAI